MHPSKFVRRGAGILMASAVGAGTLVAAAPAAQAADPAVGYLAQAYGTYAYNSDRSLVSGPTGYTGIACTTTPNRMSHNETGVVELEDVGRVGATETSARSIEAGSTRASESTSQTATTRLLGGAIKARAITSRTRVTWNGLTYTAQHESKLADLTVLGARIPVSPAPNTKIDITLPLVGKVAVLELNKQQHQMINGEYTASTTAFHLSLLPGNPWTKKLSTDVWIGRSLAALTQPTSGVLTGRGFATRVNLANGLVQSGPTSLASIACLGGVRNNSVASVNLPQLAIVGGAKTRAEGSASLALSSSNVTNEIAGANLLNGAITAEAIKTVASAKRFGPMGSVALSSAGSKLVGLQIKGIGKIDVNVKPNTKIDLLGLADITLYKTVKRADSIAVTMIEIVIKDDTLGLPVGSKIEVGHAFAGVLS